MSLRLFVGNLSYDVTESELRSLFSEVGSVTVVRLPLDRESGRPRGFAFVDFAELDAGREAISRFHQQTFMGRTLAVSEAVARDNTARVSTRSESAVEGVPQRAAGQIQRTFGPDALPRNKRRPAGRGGGEKRPRGPLKESKAGRTFGSGLADDSADGSDLVPFWAVDIEKQTGDE